MLNIFSKFLDSNEREIKKLGTVVESVNQLEKKYAKLTDKQLQSKSAEFKSQYQKGKTLEDLLPDAFAAVREAASRKLKMRHFDVQLVAATALHQGKIAEQKTGEGKTLSATPALFLNAIAGNGVHLVTVNDYLARRDCGWMGPIFHALGATCATIVHDAAFIYDPKYKDTTHEDKRLQYLRPISRKEAYQADVTYGTNNEFGFDYLRDNMAFRLSDQAQRGHYYAVVDEVDSILIDEARTPLIISAPAQEATEKYYEFAKLIKNLSSSTDYVVDEKSKTVHLTEHGTIKVEKLLGVDNLYEKDFSTLHHIEQGLKARTLFEKDRDYVVRDNEVVIVDEFTGRLMEGRRYSEGLHQAIEAKESVQIQQESKTLATISFQNYFRLYEKLAGMTGTAATEAEEFHKIYKLDVVVIPTHRSMVRADHSDTIYKTQKAKYTAVANLVAELYEKGQPVLVGTTAIDKNEFLSDLLKHKGISHAVLNAKNHEKEAEIIAQAGQKGSVTVATNMAGRGVDIILGKGVDKLSGLYVIGTERHESRRIDNQLRGRSGRQGDPGETRFFVSLEDDLMRIFGGDQVAKVMNFLKMPEDVPIEHGLVSKAIEGAQKKVEGHNFDIRKHTVEYDDVMNQQRQIIYRIRKRVLETAENKDNSLKNEILEKITQEINNIVLIHSEETINLDKIIEGFSSIIPLDPESLKGIRNKAEEIPDTEKISQFLFDLAKGFYQQREKQVGEEVARQMEVFVYLNTIDTLWIEHLDTMDDLRAGIGLRGYAQRDPLIEYKRESFDLFERLMTEIDYEIVHRIYKVGIQNQQPRPVAVVEQKSAVIDNTNIPYAGTKVTVERGGQVVSQQVLDEAGSIQHNKIGRNDLCWCGSGRKYKKCHYPN
ncbi:preprotein translocase subunit SecA [Candidatus Daviesbacteria bacterium]|nr:preprotein translocase subunit SecA [Candidatus Daviesbacteria bacterium]